MTQAAESRMVEQRREPDGYSPTQIEAAKLVVELGRDLGYPEDPIATRVVATAEQ